MKTIGVDVSHWEGSIDWQFAARFIPFVYMKCTDGTGNIDGTFEQNQAGCNEFGIAHAPYHYFQPSRDPGAQADHFIRTAGKNYPRYVVDVEEDEGADVNLVTSLHSFLQRCEELTSKKPAIYTSAGYWNQYVKPKPSWANSYELLVAHYTVQHIPILPIGWSTWTIWQFSDGFYFPGCQVAADGDWFNGNLTECYQWFGNHREVDPPSYSFRARSLFDKLHVRVEPSTLAREVDHLSKGETVDVEQLGGQDVWIRHAQGWTCVEKAGYRYMEVLK